jgi:hypothetical protein
MYFNFVTAGQNYTRTITHFATPSETIQKSSQYLRKEKTNIAVGTSVKENALYSRRAIMDCAANDKATRNSIYARAVDDTAPVTDVISHLKVCIRTVLESVVNFDMNRAFPGIVRFIADSAGVFENTKRTLCIVARIVSVGFVRDYVKNNLLKSKTELVIHSRITREIEIESDLR